MKWLLKLLTSIMILICLSSCYQYAADNYKVPEVTAPPPPVVTDQANNQLVGGKKLRVDKLKSIDPNIIYDTNAVVTHKNFTYKINSVKINEPTFKKTDLADGAVVQNGIVYNTYDLFNSDGKLKEGYSFIEININIKNNLNQDVTQFINSYDIWAIDKDYKYDYSLICCYPSAFDKSKYKTSDPIYFGYDFKPNEESTFNIAYIASNEELKRNLVLLVNDTPFNGDENVDVKFIRINTVK